MESTTVVKYKEILSRYLPASVVDKIFQYIVDNKVIFRITPQRSSKLGDYRHPFPGSPHHQITVNGDLNPYYFLFVLLHEMAHLNNYIQFQNRVQAHGHEWQEAYRQLLIEYMNEFPTDVIPLIHRYVKRLPLSHPILRQVEQQLKHYDSDYNPATEITLNDLPAGTRFCLADNPQHRFQSIEKRRTRWICQDLDSGKKYSVLGAALVKPL